MIEELGAVLAAIDAAGRDPGKLPALLATLIDASRGSISRALLLRSAPDGKAFVIAASRGNPTTRDQVWTKLPLRRLFARMKPSRLGNAFESGSLSLAIPFVYDHGSWVVVAPISGPGFVPEHDHFFNALEQITVPAARSHATESIEVPTTPTEPDIVGLGLCNDVAARVEAVVQRRGWEIEHVSALGDLARNKEPPPDIVVIDACRLYCPQDAITSLHRIIGSGALQVISFSDEPLMRFGSDAFVDAALPHGANADSIFRALKETVRALAGMRSLRASEFAAAIKHDAGKALSLPELANLAATNAAKIVEGWASCFFVNERGAVYRAEHPKSIRPVIARIPKTFLSDFPIFHVRAGDEFIEEITDDPVEQLALTGVTRFSGASVPLVSTDGSRCGVLVASSGSRCADSHDFERLAVLATVLGQRHGGITRDGIPEFRRERAWEHLRDGAVGIDVYRSADCFTPWRYRALSMDVGLLTIGLKDDSDLHGHFDPESVTSESALAARLAAIPGHTPSFAAAIELSSQSMRYAAYGFPPPLSLDARGPAATIHSWRGVTSGVATLASGSGTAIVDSDIWRWLVNYDKTGPLSEAIAAESPLGLASIVRLG